MTIENPNVHYIPFEIDSDNHVQDFQVPHPFQIEKEVEDLAEIWEHTDDLTQYIDYNVTQIRNAQALAQAAEEKAKFAQRTAKGLKANVEYRRGLIEAALNSAVSRGLLPKPAVKSAEYSLGIQGTAGRIEIDSDLDYWREEVAERLTFVSKLLLIQIMDGDAIEIPFEVIDQLNKFSKAYKENTGSAKVKDFEVFKVNTLVSWDKKYLAQAIKNNWLTDKLAALFTVVKGKALVIRL